MASAYTKNEDGAILVIALIAFLMITVAGATMVTMIASSSSSHMNVDPSHRAFYLAESGKLLADYLKLSPDPDLTYTFNLNADESIEVSFSGSALGGYYIKSQGRIKAGNSASPIFSSQLYAIRTVNYNYTYEFEGERSDEPFDAVLVLTLHNEDEDTADPDAPDGQVEDGDIIDDESEYDNDMTSAGVTTTLTTTLDTNPYGESGDRMLQFNKFKDDGNLGSNISITGKKNDTIDLSDAGALMAWVYIDGPHTIATFFSKGQANGNETYSLSYLNKNLKTLDVGDVYGGELVLRLELDPKDGKYHILRSGSTRLEINEWHHIAATWETTSATGNTNGTRLYIDGVKVDSSPQVIAFHDVDKDLVIGSNITSNEAGDHFNGYMDDIFIFDRKMTEAEIQSLYLRRVLHYPFDREALTKISDLDTLVTRRFDTIEVKLENGERGNITADESVYRRHGILHPMDYEVDGTPNPSVGNVLERTPGDAALKGEDDMSAYLFADRNDYISAGNIPFNFRGSFSIVSSFAHEDLSNSGTIVENFGQFELEHSYDKVKFGVRANATHRYDEEPLSTGWHNIVGVYNSSTVQLFIDGINNSANDPTLTGVPEQGTSLVIGRGALSSNNLEGEIDGVSVYARALRPFEISDLAAGNLPYHNNTGIDVDRYPIASYWWSLDEINSSTAVDYVSGFVGTVVGDVEAVEYVDTQYAILDAAYQFDGTGDYVTFPGLTLNSGYSINLWINKTNIPFSAGESLFNIDGGPAVSIDINGTVATTSGTLYVNGSTSSSTLTNTTSWNMITLVVPGSVSNKVFELGNGYAGMIDELYIYNKELNPNEIKTVYNNMKP